ncbi:MAG TPA: hypothetical protein VK604_00980 [Bryobacteraceae bacterium]|nr:hypothetical protein [Bryobacteraceae bacterium]
MSYINSNANRFYAALESNYGTAATVTAANRFPAVRLDAHQSLQPGKRLDKTGTRTHLGFSASSRRKTAFNISTYLTSWTGAGQPGYGPLVQAAMGAPPVTTQPLIIATVTNGTQLTTTSQHNLSVGMAISNGSDIRFVTAVSSPTVIVINAPFVAAVAANTPLAPAITYQLSTALPSVTLFDYWDPAGSAVSRMLTGAAMDVFEIIVNGNYHELSFGGPAADLLDSYSLSTFPGEPVLVPFDYSIVPGQLGQVWLGAPANQFLTLTAANIAVKNNIDARDREFGSSYPRAIAAGPREVLTAFTLFAQNDAQTNSLYAAAKHRNPIAAMLQLGRQQGQIMGIFVPNVVPEIPLYNDSETRLLWEFKNNLGQGTSNDEIYVAFA